MNISAMANLVSSGPSDSSLDARSSLNPRLVSAAHEFEASLMQELLKPLQEDSLFASSEDSHGSNETLMSFGSQALAKALSEHGGLGIATQVLQHFRADSKPQDASTAQREPEMKRAGFLK